MRWATVVAVAVLATASPLNNEVRADDYATTPNRRAHVTHPLGELYLARAFKIWCELEFYDEHLREIALWVMREYIAGA